MPLLLIRPLLRSALLIATPTLNPVVLSTLRSGSIILPTPKFRLDNPRGLIRLRCPYSVLLLRGPFRTLKEFGLGRRQTTGNLATTNLLKRTPFKPRSDLWRLLPIWLQPSLKSASLNPVRSRCPNFVLLLRCPSIKRYQGRLQTSTIMATPNRLQ